MFWSNVKWEKPNLWIRIKRNDFKNYPFHYD